MPPRPATPDQIEQWVRDGHITARQGRALLTSGDFEAAAAVAASARPKGALRRVLGPAPSWASAWPPLLGSVAALLLCVAFIVLDTVAAKSDALRPGDLLEWIPLALAVALFLAALAARLRLREGLLACSLVLGCAVAALHPHPPALLMAASLVAALAVLALGLQPGTRMVAGPVALVGLALSIGGLNGQAELDSPVAVGVAFVAIFVLWFSVPHASGWRLVPFLFLAGLWTAAVLAVLGTVIAAIATQGISTPDGVPDEAAGGYGTLLLAIVVSLLFPTLLVLLWRLPVARRFVLPTVPLPEVTLHRPRGRTPA